MAFSFKRRRTVPGNGTVVPVPVYGPDQLAVDRANSMFVSSNPSSPMSRGIYEGQPAFLSGDRGSGISGHKYSGGVYVDGHNVQVQNFYSAVHPQANPMDALVGVSSLPNTGSVTGTGGTASAVALMGLGQGSLGLGN
ncbi:hypothetical protein GCM10009765_65220 [Fodinicola feengrottensis]|uniref:Uncharacterized protein n=1 Tax=Fodinicola feengrottensis TaxID=435914 RepID=A0ABN2IKS9_9ACTN